MNFKEINIEVNTEYINLFQLKLYSYAFNLREQQEIEK